MLKKILLFCFISSMTMLPVSATETAYVSIETSVESSDITMTATGDTEPEVAEIDGECVWKIANALNSCVLFDIDESFGNSSVDGSSFLIDIEYYDALCDIPEGDSYLSFFTIWVDKLNYGMQRVQDVPLVGDGKWKNVAIEIEDAAFQNTIDGKGDIKISLYERKANEWIASYVPLYFKSLTITKIEKKNPVLVESYIEEVGNTFAYFEKKQVLNTFTNTQDTDLSLNAEYYLTDKYGNIKFSFNESFVIPAKSESIRSVDINCRECGLFEWIVKITDDTGKINKQFNEDTIAIVKTANDGLKCTSSWIVCHLERYSEEMQRACLELINHANITGVRLHNTWYTIETSSGLDVENSKFWKPSELCDEYNIDYWVMLSGCSPLYQETDLKYPRKIPTTEKELEGWEKFCKYIIEKYASRGVELFEIWNEPNVEYFNSTNATPSQLAEITKRAKKAANELLEEGKIQKPVKIAGLSVTNINSDATYENWLKPAIDAGIAGGEYGMDVLNLHTYQHGVIPEQIKSYNSVQKYRDYIYEQTGIKDIPILVSEYGNCTRYDYVTEESRRDWTVRSLILYKMYGIGEQVAVYNLEDKGLLSQCKDDHFGLVSPVYEELSIEGKYGIPTEAYLSYAAMNYVLRGEITPVEMLDCGENIKINRLSRKTLGDEVLALWTAYDEAEIQLKLGTNSVTYYDCFGNEHIMASSDGIYTLKLNNSVAYITGKFADVELVDAKQIFYEGFSEHKSYVPYGWTKSSIEGTINIGADIAPLKIDEQHGTSLKIGSRPRDNQYGNHAILREIGYVVENGTPVKFHTDLRIQETEEVTWYNPVWKDNSYHVCITSSSDIEDTILGFKLVGEAGFTTGTQIRVYYWDENSNDFVKSDTVVFGDNWISLDAIYYPDTGNVDYYVDNTKAGSGKAVIGENKVLKNVLLAAQTKHSTDATTMCPGIYDNVCLMPYDETTKPVFFTEMGHSADNTTIKFNTTALNQFASTDTVTILTAFYDEKGRLLDIIKEPKTLSGTMFQNISTEAGVLTDGMRVKFFIWDMDGITPLSPTYEVKYN